jgi:hypothetical protein
MQDLGVLQEMAERVGVKVLPAESRGEVILSFPSLLSEGEYTLRLSRVKAFSLLFWLDVKLSIERGKAEAEAEKRLKGGESHG